MTGQSPAHVPGSVWVVIPAYCEQDVIGETVTGVCEAGWNVVVVDDGSPDETAQRARGASATVLRHPTNRGQGAALQTGIDYALSRGASAVVTFDADGQHDPRDIPLLLCALEDGADVALGSRFLGTVEGATGSRLMFLRAAIRVSNVMSGLRLTDAHCGIRAISVGALPRLRIRKDGMAHASEVLRAIKRHGLNVREVPVTVRYTDYSRAKGQRSFQALRILFDYFFH